MSKLLKITNLLLNLQQLGIKKPRVQFDLEDYDRDTKFIAIGLSGKYLNDVIEYHHRIPVDMISIMHFAEHEEHFLTDAIIRHLLDHIINKKHALDRQEVKRND